MWGRRRGQIAGLLALLLLTACESARSDYRRDAGRIIRADPALAVILSETTLVEQLASGFSFLEGPVWVSDGAKPYLAFSDLRGNALHRWYENGRLTTVKRPFFVGTRGINVGPNGSTVDPQGRLVVCDSGNRRIVRLGSNGQQTVLVDRYRGRRLNSPNDLVYRSDGSLYFTDPPHGLVGEDRSPEKELAVNGVFRLGGDGALELLATDLARPNGIALTADERTLYVSDTAGRVLAYAVRDDGSLGTYHTFREGAGADGLKVDRMGHVYVATPAGVVILTKDGRELGTIVVDERPSNLAWGEEGSALYITASRALYRVRLAVLGVRPFASGPGAR